MSLLGIGCADLFSKNLLLEHLRLLNRIPPLYPRGCGKVRYWPKRALFDAGGAPPTLTISVDSAIWPVSARLKQALRQ